MQRTKQRIEEEKSCRVGQYSSRDVKPEEATWPRKNHLRERIGEKSVGLKKVVGLRRILTFDEGSFW